MERFPLNSALLNRYETFSAPDEIEEDEQPWTDEQYAAADALLEATMCPVRYRVLVEASGTLGEMSDALKAHEAGCVACGSTKKTVVSDRLMLGTQAVPCCGEAA